ALEAYDRRPDCFARSSRHIRTRCGEAEMTEDERTRAAIHLTLCEINTARHISYPLECAPFSPESLASQDVSKDAKEGAPQARCVEALSRSAQFWSSYSGYLREIRKG
ncbi:hypothetical protein PUNSTDRAFT_67835, partial [Punctularia strigosozonata HHB-11173 SS5]|uniref:uncharacterized protein n=1 Tax=Punctularia strigosozonata (strain HHB-11173) TaxID=741275 RepID=UPI0004416743